MSVAQFETVKTVMVVDDDSATFKGISRLGNVAGFSVAHANNYQEFIAWMTQVCLVEGDSPRVFCVVMNARLINIAVEKSIPPPLHHFPRIYMGSSQLSDELIQFIKSVSCTFVEIPFVLEVMHQHILEAFMKHEQCINDTRQNAQFFSRLSEREYVVGQLVSQGLTNPEIAMQLNISIKTVKAHRANVMKKLNLASIADLVRRFDRFGEKS